MDEQRMPNVRRNILISGHRGTRVHEIENTAAAFKFCIDHSFDYVEFDVRKTADGHIVVFHDRFIGRLLVPDEALDKKYPKDIEKLTLEQLGKLRYRDGQRVQTLEELFEQLDKKIRPMLEIKSRGISEKVIDIIHKFGYEKDEIIIQSFVPADIRECFKADPQYDYGLCMSYLGKSPLGIIRRINASLLTKFILRKVPFVKWLNLDGPFIYDEFMERIRSLNLHVILGAKNTERYLDYIDKWNVEIINCDDGVAISEILMKKGYKTNVI